MFEIRSFSSTGVWVESQPSQKKVFQEVLALLHDCSLSQQLAKIQKTVTISLLTAVPWPASITFDPLEISFQASLFDHPQRLLPYLLFELLNLHKQAEFAKIHTFASKRTIDKKLYVLLTQIVQNTQNLQKNLMLKQTPGKTATRPSFEAYLQTQEANGHCRLIEAEFDRISQLTKITV